MSVLVKGMKMPERCEGCLMYRHNAEYDYAYCCISSVNVLGHGNARLNNCPLVEVPTPHGRLIDAADLLKTIAENAYLVKHGYNEIEYGMTCFGIMQAISEQPTIIEAEEGEPHEQN